MVILKNVGLKEAAKREVGTGPGQIPDMSSFTSGPGWVRFPDGTTIQQGSAGFAIGVNNQYSREHFPLQISGSLRSGMMLGYRKGEVRHRQRRILVLEQGQKPRRGLGCGRVALVASTLTGLLLEYHEMTIEYVWSPSTAGFYPIIEKERLIAAGEWPEDGVDVTGEEYGALFPAPPGKFIDTLDGRPQWVDMPPPSEEQLIAMAENERTARRTVANNEINWRQDAVDAGIATEEETAGLAAWKKYRVLLMRVDTAKPVWPTPPGE